MKRLLFIVALGMVSASVQASSQSPARPDLLHRDERYEDFIRFRASVDTAVTPARVLCWFNSILGQPTKPAPTTLEFQPIFRAQDSHEVIIGQFAYKF